MLKTVPHKTGYPAWERSHAWSQMRIFTIKTTLLDSVISGDAWKTSGKARTRSAPAMLYDDATVPLLEKVKE
jgi:hypothetical protein